jgi:hypothetical protein
MEDATPDRDRLEELIRVGQSLLVEIQNFAKAGGQQFTALAGRARSNRRAIVALSVSLALDIALTVIMAIGWVQVTDNDDRIAALTERLDQAQTVQRQKALCPLYQLLLDSKSAASRAAAPDPKAYDHAFEVIQSGYDAFQCSVFIAGQ